MTSTLNYSLDQLNSSKYVNIKILNPKKVNFDSKYILKELISIYTNFENNDKFCQSITKDQRSYSNDLFIKTIKLLEK